MFSQIQIRDEDLDSQRFLWRGMDRQNKPDVYEMKSMMFGPSCSPASAIFVKNKNAEDFKSEFPQVWVSCEKNMYMDDLLESADTREEASEHIRNVIEVHRRGGFHICNWTCNDKDVLQSIPEEFRASGYKNLNCETGLPTERVLGMWWNSEKDEFTFKLNLHKVDSEIRDGKRIPTKREVLSLLMSVFDPLGMIVHLIIKGRMLLQDVWKLGIGWDDKLSEDLFQRWLVWLSELKKITTISIPRCYDQLYTKAKSIELHSFCDASSQGFAAAAYFRIETEFHVRVVLVGAKAKVAPLQLMSIPRLELQAALLASRLSVTIEEEHDVKCHRKVFWSDSRIVLSWIRSYDKRFKIFVGHRVGEIQECTDSQDWKWVPTKENVADDATRDAKISDVSNSSRWFNGPDFLKLSEDKWPKETKLEDLDNMDNMVEFVALIVPPKIIPLPDIRRFSSWLKLVRSTAWMLRFVNNLKKRNKQIKKESFCELSAEELNQAEVLWIKQVQIEHFNEELTLLKSSKSVARSSKIFRLFPVLDLDEVLRIPGRLDQADLPSFVKSPYLLDPNHSFTKLLIQHHHELLGHQGQETIVNEIRQKYWILKLKTLVKKICRNCQNCKIQHCKPVIPQMGLLPSFRITPQSKPFVFTGLDFFGPFYVKVRRVKEKVYGVIFTCMTTRAIHVETSSSLSTDSAIMAIRRFVSRRGKPNSIFSDNATNFRGADRELKEAIQGFDQNQIQCKLSANGINWVFNPPGAPHFGGSWERLIRTVKTALRATLKGRITTLEVFQTLMVEAEHIVNSRPLTEVSCDVNDPNALTPNNFLIPNAGVVCSPGCFTDNKACLRKQWKQTQRLVDYFCTR